MQPINFPITSSGKRTANQANLPLDSRPAKRRDIAECQCAISNSPSFSSHTTMPSIYYVLSPMPSFYPIPAPMPPVYHIPAPMPPVYPIPAPMPPLYHSPAPVPPFMHETRLTDNCAKSIGQPTRKVPSTLACPISYENPQIVESHKPRFQRAHNNSANPSIRFEKKPSRRVPLAPITEMGNQRQSNINTLSTASSTIDQVVDHKKDKQLNIKNFENQTPEASSQKVAAKKSSQLSKHSLGGNNSLVFSRVQDSYRTGNFFQVLTELENFDSSNATTKQIYNYNLYKIAANNAVGNYEEALRNLQDCEQATSTYTANQKNNFIIHKVTAYIALGKHEEALRELQQFDLNDPDPNLKNHYLIHKARIYSVCGQLKEALSVLQEFDPECSSTRQKNWFILVKAFINGSLQKYEQAIEDLRSFDSKNATANQLSDYAKIMNDYLVMSCLNLEST